MRQLPAIARVAASLPAAARERYLDAVLGRRDDHMPAGTAWHPFPGTYVPIPRPPAPPA